MGKTFVIMKEHTTIDSMIIAKNNSKSPNEPNVTIKIPAKHNDLNTVEITNSVIEQVSHTYSLVLLKPSWTWGGEFGFNEHGLYVTCESTVTRGPSGPKKIIGEDYVRILLERCKTPECAIKLLIELLNKYGLGGNVGYDFKVNTHNSFIIANQDSAYVFEAAGQLWAYKQVDDYHVIGRNLTITNDFDEIHPQAIEYAIENNYCSNKKNFNFASSFSINTFTKLSSHANISDNIYKILKQPIDLSGVIDILKSHHINDEKNLFIKKTVSSICCHAGGVYSRQTTNSIIALVDLQKQYLTGSSIACLSLYKPITFNSNKILLEFESKFAIKFWYEREVVHRLFIANRIDQVLYKDKLIKYQAAILEADEDQAWYLEKEFYKSINKTGTSQLSGSLFFNRYWKKKNKELRNKIMLNNSDFK